MSRLFVLHGDDRDFPNVKCIGLVESTVHDVYMGATRREGTARTVISLAVKSIQNSKQTITHQACMCNWWRFQLVTVNEPRRRFTFRQRRRYIKWCTTVLWFNCCMPNQKISGQSVEIKHGAFTSLKFSRWERFFDRIRGNGVYSCTGWVRERQQWQPSLGRKFGVKHR